MDLNLTEFVTLSDAEKQKMLIELAMYYERPSMEDIEGKTGFAISGCETRIVLWIEHLANGISVMADIPHPHDVSARGISRLLSGKILSLRDIPYLAQTAKTVSRSQSVQSIIRILSDLLRQKEKNPIEPLE